MKINKLLKAISYKLRTDAGFTLIETVIYIALFSLIASSVIVVFYQIIGSQGQHRDRVEVDAEANFMMQKMIWALTGATAINQPTAGATSSVLSVNKYNFSQNPIVFDVSSRNLRITRATGTPVFLGNNKVYVNQLTFLDIAASNASPEGIKITLSVVSSDIEQPIAPSTTISDTIYLRQ